MWDDAIIGSGKKGSSAINFRDIGSDGCNISQNDVSFWISRVYLGMGMTIMKDTPEGIYLEEMLETNMHDDLVLNFLIRVLIKNANPDKLRTRIDNAIHWAKQEGSEARASVIRDALGV